MTVEEWRILERESHDVRHEYIDGYVYAMAGGTLANTRIAFNATSVLDALLGDGPCIAYMADAATRLSADRYTYPDVVVTCGEDRAVARRDITEVDSPRVVVEVLSESTERYDHGRKFSYHRECESLQEYVLVATEYQAVEVHRRLPEGWDLYRTYGPGDEVALASIGVRFPVAALYRRTDVPALPPE